MVLIPTPGQFEQFYLAQYLNLNKKVTLINQEDLNFKSLTSAIDKYGI
jgi:hypothetical protein